MSRRHAGCDCAGEGQGQGWLKAQRIGTMPDDELTKAYNEAREAGRLLHYNELVIRARPWWYKENRKARHRAIHAGAVGKMVLKRPGPFPLIYSSSGDGITRGLAFL